MVQPSKEQLFGAVSSFLLKVIQLIVPFVFVQPSQNSDLFFLRFALQQEDDVGPKAMKAKILTEHPDWKVSERRVKKYIKRHSSGLKPSDMDDESTAVEGTKPKSFMKRLFQRKRRSSQMAPISVIEEGVLKTFSETDMEAGVEAGAEAGAEAAEPYSEVKTSGADGAAEKGKSIDEKIYEEIESEGKKDCECEVCIIS